jgi:hypothetical protein
VSPPAAAAQAAPGTRTREPVRRRYSPPKPRRVSGPARRTPGKRPAHARLRRGGLLLWLLSALERLASHRLLDRLIRGRAWLMVLTFALIGIVTLQLALLKLNGAMGRALHSQALLQRENAALSIENSELSAADHVQAGAAQLGLAFASSASLRFLTPSLHGDFARGAAALASPLHAPAAASEPASNGRSGGSSGEGGGAERGEGRAGEASGGEGRSSEARGGEGGSSEARTSEGGSSEARTSEGTGSHPASGEGESASSSAASEAPASAAAPARSGEASSSAEAASSGGAQAGPGR